MDGMEEKKRAGGMGFGAKIGIVAVLVVIVAVAIFAKNGKPEAGKFQRGGQSGTVGQFSKHRGPNETVLFGQRQDDNACRNFAAQHGQIPGRDLAGRAIKEMKPVQTVGRERQPGVG